jgi:hypothetical protein
MFDCGCAVFAPHYVVFGRLQAVLGSFCAVLEMGYAVLEIACAVFGRHYAILETGCTSRTNTTLHGMTPLA